MAILKRSVTAPRPPETYNTSTAARDAFRIAESRNLRTQPLDVEGLATSIGLKVSLETMPNEISGYLRKKDGYWILGVNSLHHPNRRRFTIAHELGHYFLHRHLGDFEDTVIFRREQQPNPREYEANEFAARLLMPEDKFLLARNRLNNDIGAIAHEFGVSELATRFRIDNVIRQLEID
jgi:Zn-dependent peptidase ImmA (M78 family)